MFGFLLTLAAIGSFLQPLDSPTAAAALAVITSIVPYSGLLTIWTMVGVFSMVAAWSIRLQPWAYAFMCGLFFFMAVGFGVAWLVYGVPRAWFSALLYAGLFGALFFVSGWEERP